jgi:glycosyltransferase involved in cell wall biosynthesis
MRLLFIITRGDLLGGAQSYVRDLAFRFAADGDDVQVVTGAMGAMTEALTAAGITVVPAPGLLRQIHPLHDVRSVASLARLMRGFRPDLVTTHSSKAGVVGRIAARLAGVPCIHTANGWSFNPAEPAPVRLLYRLLERTTAPFAARFICVSDHGRGLGIAAGIAPDRLVTIHNGIPDVSADLRASAGRPGPMRLACVARFQPPKDHRTLLLAVRDVLDVQLDLIGDGPNEDEARTLVRELRIGDRVRFLGARRDVPELLAQAQAFALCSRSEGFPLSTLEAMRQGLPVVVSNAGGAPEAVRDGETGFVVADNSVAVWADRLARLARDPGLRSRMGTWGRAFYEERFTFEQMYARIARLYREIAQQATERERAVNRPVTITPDQDFRHL